MEPIDKPQSLALKDYLIRKTAVKTMINERAVADIINFQFQDARQALHTAKQVEMTGFGKYVFQERKALKERERLLEVQARLRSKELTDKIAAQLLSVEDELAFINSKITPDETLPTDSGRLEK